MGKRSKKIKHIEKPKRKLEYRLALSDLDTFIYLFVCAALFIGAIVLFVHQLLVRDNLALSDKSVIAYSGNGYGVLFSALPLIILMLYSCITIWKDYFKAMRPIFGRKDFEYDDDLEYGEYPLFYRHKPTDAASLKQKKKRKRKAIIISVIFAVCLILFPFSLAKRQSMTYSGDIIMYNSFNKETHRYSKEDIRYVTFLTQSKFRGNIRYGTARTDYSYLMTVTMNDGNEFSFYPGGFQNNGVKGKSELIKGMIYVKEYFGAKAIIGSTEYIDRIINRSDFTDYEISLLYELFEIKQ